MEIGDLLKHKLGFSVTVIKINEDSLTCRYIHKITGDLKIDEFNKNEFESV